MKLKFSHKTAKETWIKADVSTTGQITILESNMDERHLLELIITKNINNGSTVNLVKNKDRITCPIQSPLSVSKIRDLLKDTFTEEAPEYTDSKEDVDTATSQNKQDQNKLSSSSPSSSSALIPTSQIKFTAPPGDALSDNKEEDNDLAPTLDNIKTTSGQSNASNRSGSESVDPLLKKFKSTSGPGTGEGEEEYQPLSTSSSRVVTPTSQIKFAAPPGDALSDNEEEDDDDLAPTLSIKTISGQSNASNRTGEKSVDPLLKKFKPTSSSRAGAGEDKDEYQPPSISGSTSSLFQLNNRSSSTSQSLQQQMQTANQEKELEPFVQFFLDEINKCKKQYEDATVKIEFSSISFLKQKIQEKLTAGTNLKQGLLSVINSVITTAKAPDTVMGSSEYAELVELFKKIGLYENNVSILEVITEKNLNDAIEKQLLEDFDFMDGADNMDDTDTNIMITF